MYMTTCHSSILWVKRWGHRFLFRIQVFSRQEGCVALRMQAERNGRSFIQCSRMLSAALECLGTHSAKIEIVCEVWHLERSCRILESIEFPISTRDRSHIALPVLFESNLHSVFINRCRLNLSAKIVLWSYCGAIPQYCGSSTLFVELSLLMLVVIIRLML